MLHGKDIGLKGGQPLGLLVALMVVTSMVADACSAPGHMATRQSGTHSLLPSSPTSLPLFEPGQFRDLLAELRGKPVLVNVWASWCGPCVVEAPALARVARDYEGRVQFLGVDVLDQRAAAQSFIRKYGWIFPSVFDPTGSIRDDLGFVGQPVTIVFDRSGKRVFTWSGATPETRLRKELDGVV